MDRTDDTPPAAAPGAATPWPRGQRVGSFELIEAVAGGAGGYLYRAWDHALARQVAVKEYLPPALAARDAHGDVVAAAHTARSFARCRDALVDSWRTLARCDHPALVRLLHVVEAHGTVYGVMPWHAGHPLAAPPPEGMAPLDAPALRALLDGVLGALETYHRAGRVHGDIGASKVLRLDGGGAVLLGPGAPVHAAERIGDAPLGPWTDVHALAALFEPLVATPGGRDGALHRAIEAALSPDTARRPLNVAQFRAWLAAEAAQPAAAAPAGASDPVRPEGPGAEAESHVDAAAAEVIRRVLDSIPDPVPARRPAPRAAPAQPADPRPAAPPEALPFSAVMGDDAPPYMPQPRASGNVRRPHWGLRGALAVIFVTGSALVVTQVQEQDARAAVERLVSALSPEPPPAVPQPAAAPPPAPLPAPAPAVVTTPPLPPAAASDPAPAAARAPPPAAPAADTRPGVAAGRPAPAAPTSPRAACSGRSEFALYRCMQQQCQLDRWWPHAQCIRLRATDTVG